MSETIGTRLRQAREQRRLTIAQVATETRIQRHYLEALESDDLSSIPSAAQARGFLRNYLVFLGLNDSALPVAPPGPLEGPLPGTSPAPTSGTEETPAVSASGPARPTLLSRMRQRLGRRSDSPAAALQAEGADSETLPPQPPEPKPFVPVRYTEELPAAPEANPEQGLAGGPPSSATKPIRRKAASSGAKPRPASLTRSARARRAAALSGDIPGVEKKKIAP